jgi:hypothetical protein
VEKTAAPHPDLEDAAHRLDGRVPLTWARSVPGIANLGDATSTVIVGAMSGMPPAALDNDTPSPRLAAIGTIGHELCGSTVHLWGTGVDAGRRAFGDRMAGFAAAPDTRYVIHATRGPHSRRTLLAAGIDAPPIHGDGAWFLPRVIPRTAAAPAYELGVMLHLSELESISLGAGPIHRRYQDAVAAGARIISPLHPTSWRGFQSKVAELLSCRRIVSMSLHGLILAETYGIPCLPFTFDARGIVHLDTEAGEMDHRYADFYRGAGRRYLPAYAQPFDEATDWHRVMAAVDRYWTPLSPPGIEAFYDAFPLAKAVTYDSPSWPLTQALLARFAWE